MSRGEEEVLVKIWYSPISPPAQTCWKEERRVDRKKSTETRRSLIFYSMKEKTGEVYRWIFERNISLWRDSGKASKERGENHFRRSSGVWF